MATTGLYHQEFESPAQDPLLTGQGTTPAPDRADHQVIIDFSRSLSLQKRPYKCIENWLFILGRKSAFEDRNLKQRSSKGRDSPKPRGGFGRDARSSRGRDENSPRRQRDRSPMRREDDARGGHRDGGSRDRSLGRSLGDRDRSLGESRDNRSAVGDGRDRPRDSGGRGSGGGRSGGLSGRDYDGGRDARDYDGFGGSGQGGRAGNGSSSSGRDRDLRREIDDRRHLPAGGGERRYQDDRYADERGGMQGRKDNSSASSRGGGWGDQPDSRYSKWNTNFSELEK